MKELIDAMKQIATVSLNVLRQAMVRQKSQGKKSAAVAELIRNTHSIEKGLSLSEPRLGFGQTKIKSMIEIITVLEKEEDPYCREACQMALGALNEYAEYHAACKYADGTTEALSKFLKPRREQILTNSEKYGGTIVLNRAEMVFDEEQLERLFATRHSIRDFDECAIDMQKLNRALELAQRAPSACNRQAVRVHVLDGKDDILQNWLGSIGGFENKIAKAIIITAKTSAYRLQEVNQYIVTASMYAAYLSLTLHGWGKIMTCLQADPDEQVVCLIAVGNMKEMCRVPVSHRLKTAEMVRWHDRADAAKGVRETF